MKRLGSSDSLGAFMPICPTTEEQSPRTTSNHVYNREFGSMLDGLDEEVCMEESGGHVGEKKRRLNVEQVKALEKNFEVENKLEPERKVRLAQELGLQPRQVAVWFQNRRARWKTKQLEKDYGVLKSTYDNLKLSHDSLRRDNESLLKEIKELKAKLNEENRESNVSVKEETVLPEFDEKVAEQLPILDSDAAEEETENLNYDGFNKSNCVGTSLFLEFKDGSSDSDSSAILNEENDSSPNRTISSAGILQNHHSRHEEEQLVMSPPPSSLKFSFINSSPSSFSPPINNCLLQYSKANYQAQFVKMEEHNFFSSEEACNFFSDEQPPTLHWYCNDQWN